MPCGDCRACCSSGYFIPVRNDETRTIEAIPPNALFHAPSHPTGELLLIGLTKSGRCSMLKNKQCLVYGLRPQACRDYDCRLFAAAGINSGIPAIDRTVKKWKFSYRGSAALDKHLSIQAAASFVQTHSSKFPSGKYPTRPDEIAITAVKAHGIFSGAAHTRRSVETVASAYVRACKYFDRYGQIYSE
uniref:YkgJ family cysteine cluster protein n=1 Tax=Hylemonella sp. TaxID=2066020 RepID=UPI0035B29823